MSFCSPFTSPYCFLHCFRPDLYSAFLKRVRLVQQFMAQQAHIGVCHLPNRILSSPTRFVSLTRLCSDVRLNPGLSSFHPSQHSVKFLRLHNLSSVFCYLRIIIMWGIGDKLPSNNYVRGWGRALTQTTLYIDGKTVSVAQWPSVLPRQPSQVALFWFVEHKTPFIFIFSHLVRVIRGEHYLYKFTRIDSEEARSGFWWKRRRIGPYFPPVTINSRAVRDYLQSHGWRVPKPKNNNSGKTWL